MTAWLMNLGFAGGENVPAFDQDTIIVRPESDIIYVHFGDEMETVYKSPDGVKKQVLDWSQWLGDSTIDTVTWTAIPADLTIGDTSNTSQTATAYFSNGSIDEEHRVDCKVVTNDAIPRTEVRSFMMHIVRKWA